MWPDRSSFFKKGNFRPCKDSFPMTPEVLQIIKEKDDYKNVIEIKQTDKLEPCVTVKIRSDGTAKEAGDMALAEYKRIIGELKKE